LLQGIGWAYSLTAYNLCKAGVMATASTHVPVEVYLQADYEHDCDYVDGEVEERVVGEKDHAIWQALLIRFFGAKQRELGILALPEQRIRVAASRYRVPDVTLLSGDAPDEQIITHPPLAVFEIMSPEDRMSRVLERLADYESMEIGAIWVIEPKDSSYYRYASGQLSPASLFHLPGSEFQVEMKEIAALLD
jgi:Uma2 family endonuclease